MKPALLAAAALAAVATMPAQATTYTLQQNLASLGGYSFASQVGANAHLDDTFRFTVGTAPVDFGGLLASSFRVGAGAIGRKALQGGVQLPKSVIALGVLATALAIVMVGRIATQVLQSMDLESDADAAGASKRAKQKV